MDNDQPLYEDKSHLDLAQAFFVGRALSETADLEQLFMPRSTTYASGWPHPKNERWLCEVHIFHVEDYSGANLNFS